MANAATATSTSHARRDSKGDLPPIAILCAPQLLDITPFIRVEAEIRVVLQRNGDDALTHD
jgi:hypothetical protein